MKVTPIAITKSLIKVKGKELTCDELMAYVARVSNPTNQGNTITMAKLLEYCAKHKHWSVFEQTDLTVEIKTSRAIAQQILRHRSFTFQEFSQRYADPTTIGYALNHEIAEARRQDDKNRQNSIDDLDDETKEWFRTAQVASWNYATNLYKKAIKKGIAKECARFFLPLNTATTMYMKGNVRSWIHYIDLRSANGTQKEHQEIALEIKEIFMEYFPLTSEALGWK